MFSISVFFFSSIGIAFLGEYAESAEAAIVDLFLDASVGFFEIRVGSVIREKLCKFKSYECVSRSRSASDVHPPIRR